MQSQTMMKKAEANRANTRECASQGFYQIALMLLQKGKTARAERVFKQGLVRLNATYNNAHPMRIIFLLRIIETFIRQSKFRIAINTYKKTRASIISDSKLSAYDLELSLLRVANEWQAKSKTKEAMEVYMDIIEVRRRRSTTDPAIG